MHFGIEKWSFDLWLMGDNLNSKRIQRDGRGGDGGGDGSVDC